MFALSSPVYKEGFFILLLECSNIKKYFGDRRKIIYAIEDR